MRPVTVANQGMLVLTTNSPDGSVLLPFMFEPSNMPWTPTTQNPA
jgi:hypothetical protein